nr:PepSY domain-containing protein [Bradyrhizobium symbiodeficiens]
MDFNPSFASFGAARVARTTEEETFVKVIRVVAIALTVGMGMGSAAMADGFKDCTKLDKASWKPASEAEAKAKALGYEVRRSKIEGSCYEVYGVKEGKLYELFYSPEDLSLKHTIAK